MKGVNARLLCRQRGCYVHAKTIRCPRDGAAEAWQIKQENFPACSSLPPVSS